MRLILHPTAVWVTITLGGRVRRAKNIEQLIVWVAFSRYDLPMLAED